ncbi:hypothetical protein V500_02424 [Pseudogymnoascus sp. VKM F-4518 (FW-2643)]|nr:hypothetical protein V500_02424 [Pseudogymnoascus sp. VKM F-4518 (FW-2643)]
MPLLRLHKPGPIPIKAPPQQQPIKPQKRIPTPMNMQTRDANDRLTTSMTIPPQLRSSSLPLPHSLLTPNPNSQRRRITNATIRLQAQRRIRARQENPKPQPFSQYLIAQQPSRNPSTLRECEHAHERVLGERFPEESPHDSDVGFGRWRGGSDPGVVGSFEEGEDAGAGRGGKGGAEVVECELRNGGDEGVGLNGEDFAGGAFAVEAEDLGKFHVLTKYQVCSLQ